MPFDTGANPMLVEDPASYPSIQAGGRYTVREEDLAPAAVWLLIGPKPEEVDLVANLGFFFFTTITPAATRSSGTRRSSCGSRSSRARGGRRSGNRDNYVRLDFDFPGVCYEELDG